MGGNPRHRRSRRSPRRGTVRAGTSGRRHGQRSGLVAAAAAKAWLSRARCQGFSESTSDGFGKRRTAPAASLRTIERAMQGARSRVQPVITTEGSCLEVGPAEIRLEDGSTLSVDRALPRDFPLGYHEIQRRGRQAVALIVAPPVCYLPRAYRAWGWAIQLYAARSRRSWGIGDLADLRWLGRWGQSLGAGIALINPLAASHADVAAAAESRTFRPAGAFEIHSTCASKRSRAPAA